VSEEDATVSKNVRHVFIVFVVVLACGSPGWPEVTTPEYVDVAPSVVMAQNPSGSNLIAIALDDGLVFVDAGLDTEVATRFRKAMEQRFDRPTKYLILTHGHLDHILAMGAFDDVGVVAAAAEKPLFEKQLAIEFNERTTAAYTQIFPTFAEVIGSARPFAPTVWVENEWAFGSGNSHIFFATTGGHTTGSSYVYYPAERVLITGDLVQVDKHPYFGDPTTDLQVWIDALKKWYAMDPARICPGHGRVVERCYLQREWEFFENLILTMRQLKIENVPIEEAVNHPNIPTGYWDEDLPEPRWWKHCLALCYRSL
jgi:glyoxylase-like metal-dependent hydrolase (beta-lactamase superfamily II)